MTAIPHEHSWILDDLPVGGPTGIPLCVIGAGFVGLVTAAGLARLGHQVVCVDINEQRIESLRQGTVDFKERHLDKLVQWGIAENRLQFDTQLHSHIANQRAIFIAVGTAACDYSQTDLAAVKSVVDAMSSELSEDQMIVVRSTVPVGTAQQIRTRLIQHDPTLAKVAIISNPEFLREGNALYDFFFPHRIAVGTDVESGHEFMRMLHRDRLDPIPPYVATNHKTAELIKYAANSFLATKLSFVNELAALCERTGADVTTVTYAMGLDPRIRPNHLSPGPGFGGSCLPKDLDEYLALGRAHDVPLRVAQGTQDTNRMQADRIVDSVKQFLGASVGSTVAILGLSYKAHTDDLRASPALAVINRLLQSGISIRAYDPAANEKARKTLDDVTICDSAVEAAQDTYMVIVMTEWPEFVTLPWAEIHSVMSTPNIFDARNILSPDAMRKLGFHYRSIGRPIETIVEQTTSPVAASNNHIEQK